MGETLPNFAKTLSMKSSQEKKKQIIL